MKHIKESEEIIGAGIDLVMCLLAVIICLLAYVVRDKITATKRADHAESKLASSPSAANPRALEDQRLLKLIAAKLGLEQPVRESDIAELHSRAQIAAIRQELASMAAELAKFRAAQTTGAETLARTTEERDRLKAALDQALKELSETKAALASFRAEGKESGIAGMSAAASERDKLAAELSTLRQRLDETLAALKDSESKRAALDLQLRDITLKMAKALEENRKLASELATLQRPFVKEYDDAGEDRSFDSGSAELLPPIKRQLDSVIIDINDRLANLDDRTMADTIEVVGHSDGDEVDRHGNIDLELIKSISQNRFPTLLPGSNSDLALLRALAAVDYLRNHSDFRSRGIKFRALSAGPTILPSRTLSANWSPFQKEDGRRRRVEIRLLKTASQGLFESIDLLKDVDRFDPPQAR